MNSQHGGWSSAVESLSPFGPAEQPDQTGVDFFSAREWFAILGRSAMQPDSRVVVIRSQSSKQDGDNAAALVALHRRTGSLGWPVSLLTGFTSPYTTSFKPLLSADERQPGMVCRDLARDAVCAHRPDLVWLDCLEDCPGVLAGLRDGFVAQGYEVEVFPHFPNWYEPIAEGFDAYWAQRPARLRNTVKRKVRKLEREHRLTLDLLTGADEAERALTAYCAVESASWKAPEPYPEFIPTLIRQGMAAGAVQVGVMTVDETVVAAQIWVISQGRATIFKLAHREDHKTLSPGTVLTWWLLKTICRNHAIVEVDFGRGDDAFKAAWLSQRRDRRVLVACNRRSLAGTVLRLRHIWLPRFARRARGRSAGSGAAGRET